MHLDPTLTFVVGLCFAVVLLGFLLSVLKQPLIIAYLLIGALLGPDALGVINDEGVIGPLGSIGLMLLMFFVGMEVRPIELARSWQIAITGTLLQILVSVAAVWCIGQLFDWSNARIVLIGFVLSLSSTAVVVKLLKDAGELNTPIGHDVLGILLVQDIAVIPMLVILNQMGGEAPDPAEIAIQTTSAIALISLVAWVVRHPGFRLYSTHHLTGNPELQVFFTLSVCLGLAFATELTGLSGVLGAFVAGVCVGAARKTDWFRESLHPFYVLLVACFFLSVGVFLDLDFLLARWKEILLLTGVVLSTNTFINALVLRILGLNWRDSLYGGGMLSQIGEFSFVLAAAGLSEHIITHDGYQLVVGTIALSLILSAPWMTMLRRFSTGSNAVLP